MSTELFYSRYLNMKTSLVLDTDYLKMARRARNLSGTFEKRRPLAKEHDNENF